MAEPREPNRPSGGASSHDDDDSLYELAEVDEPKRPVVAPLPGRPAAEAPPKADAKLRLELDDPEEPQDIERPRVGTPEAPLPRLWKAEPDDEPVAVKPAKAARDEPAAPASKSVRPSKKSKAPAKTKEPKEGEPKGVLKEETPTFDTYDTRQRVRIIAGVGVTSLFLLIGFIIFKLVSPSGTEPEESIPQDVAFIPSTAGTQTQRDDEEARALFERAREVARNKNTDLAVTLLKTVGTKYPRTRAAIEAKEALERPSQSPPLPLFLDRPAVVAKAGDPVPPKPEPPKKQETIVEASKTPLASATGGTAKLALPANPAEMATAPASTPAPTPAVAPSAAQVKPSRPLPKGYRARSGTETHESGWPLEIVGDRDGAPMLLVPGGTFLQGRDGADANEEPAHHVVLGTFYIDRHEVTNRQFNVYQTEAGKRTERARALAKDAALAALDAEEDRPVVMVSARDAKDYADWAGKFLPTEAQWEAAARTPDGRIYPWGPDPVVWNRPRAPRQIDPIMSFPADVSPYGVFDLSGNAWEWTKDWYDPKYYQQFRNAPADNPNGPVKPRSQQLVVKGSARDWTVSKRDGLRFETRLPYLGFRCVIQVEGPGNVFEPPPAAPPPGQPAAPGGNRVVVPF